MKSIKFYFFGAVFFQALFSSTIYWSSALQKLEEETGKNVGFSVVSNIRLASTKDRMDEYHQYAGVAQTIGVDVKFLTCS